MRRQTAQRMASVLAIGVVVAGCSVTGVRVPTGAGTATTTTRPTVTSASVTSTTVRPTSTTASAVSTTTTAPPTTTSGPPVVTQPASGPGSFTMAQTLSERAQRDTIAFDALAFLTGDFGADTFFPPGKVADFWGFQYLRDNDPTGMGHNTDFLTRASLNMLSILTDAQIAQLTALATEQVPAINAYGEQRFVLIAAFRRLLAGDLPTGTTGLDVAQVQSFSASLYTLDGEISLRRAEVMGAILVGLTTAQRSALDALVGTGMASWPVVDEPSSLRRLTHDEKVAVMTYAGDLFSWYAGSVDADVYFCPERQGTYFGSFYLKDAPAVGNPGYSIGTNITADMGEALLGALDPEQASLVTMLVREQAADLEEIVDVRTAVATELRRYLSGDAASRDRVLALMARYGELDGDIVYHFATNFAAVGATLSDAQRAVLMGLRHDTVGDFVPSGAFLYATEIALPAMPDTDFLFG